MLEEERGTAAAEGPSCYLLAERTKKEFMLQKKQSDKTKLVQEEDQFMLSADGHMRCLHVYPGIL